MNLTRMIARVRANTGWSNANDLSEERIKEAINYIYQRVIPNVLNWEGLQDWGYIDLIAGSLSFDFYTGIKDAPAGSAYGDRVLSIEPPPMLRSDATTTNVIGFTFDPDEFWTEYPLKTTETQDTPEKILVKGRTVHVRPESDAAYTLILWVNLRPVALTLGTHEPTEDWAEAIIAGATSELLGDDDDPEASMWATRFDKNLGIEVGGAGNVPGGLTRGAKKRPREPVIAGAA